MRSGDTICYLFAVATQGSVASYVASCLLLRRKEASPPTLPHVCCCDAEDSVASYGWFVFLQKCMHFSFFDKKLGGNR